MNKKVTITFTNRYHSTKTKISIPVPAAILRDGKTSRELIVWDWILSRAGEEEQNRIWGPARRLESRVFANLCGIRGCTCGVVCPH